MIKTLFYSFIAAIFVSCIPKNIESQLPSRIEEGAHHVKVKAPVPFKSYTGDPLEIREYTLKNGLKVYFSINKDEPRIQTYVSVKAGGKNDPSHATGLAHYLEHMLFKGTSKIGTVNFEKEQVELEKIKGLYEKYRNTADSLERVEIYSDIDSISQVAAQYVCPNEFDQIHTSIGANGTNAYTTHENTVYLTDIPSNQLENWAKAESERFKMPVLRLFHTELEAVYEEKNSSQDNHYRQQYYALLRGLYKKHNYGLQTTIGTIDHLKNPSMYEIEKFFKNYYVPNNMAVILCGDFNPDSAIAVIERNFGTFQAGPVEEYRFEQEDSIKSPVEIELKAPDASSLMMAYRFEGAGSERVYLAKMVDMILNNSKAGLIDININQQQKAVGVYSGVQVSKDYSIHVLGGSPTKGQSVQELKGLILEQIELVKKGEFPDWLMKAIINDLKVSELKGLNSNRNRAAMINESFVNNIPWEDKLQEIAKMEAITKEQVVQFANQFYKGNYVAVYKIQSDEKLNRKKVEKPAITPLNLSKENRSEFFQNFLENNNPEPIEPYFLKYEEALTKENFTGGQQLYYLKNQTNELFSLRFIIPVGSYHSPTLEFTASQIKLLGTEQFSSAALAQEMYKLGMDYSVGVGQKESTITLTGLSSEFEASVNLLQRIFTSLQPNQEILNGLIQKTLQSRENSLKNPKSILWNGLQQFAVYGEKSPLSDELSNDALVKLKSEELLSEFKQILTQIDEVVYYGETELVDVKSRIESSLLASKVNVPTNQKGYDRLSMGETRVLLLDYDLKQSEILLLSKEGFFSKEDLAVEKVFNEYYGGGMTSVIFQEIREKKALAYSAFAAYTSAKDTMNPQYTYGYLGTQTDKTIEAIEAMLNLLEVMPVDSFKFEQAKLTLKQKIASNRVTKESILYSYLANKKLGYTSEKDEDIYNGLDALTINDLVQFHQKHISPNEYTIIIVGKVDELDLDGLKKFGEVSVVTVEQLYPY